MLDTLICDGFTVNINEVDRYFRILKVAVIEGNDILGLIRNQRQRLLSLIRIEFQTIKIRICFIESFIIQCRSHFDNACGIAINFIRYRFGNSSPRRYITYGFFQDIVDRVFGLRGLLAVDKCDFILTDLQSDTALGLIRAIARNGKCLLGNNLTNLKGRIGHFFIRGYRDSIFVHIVYNIGQRILCPMCIDDFVFCDRCCPLIQIRPCGCRVPAVKGIA